MFNFLVHLQFTKIYSKFEKSHIDSYKIKQQYVIKKALISYPRNYRCLESTQMSSFSLKEFS